MSFNKDLVLINSLVIDCYIVIFHYPPPAPPAPAINLAIHLERRRQWQPTPVLLPGKIPWTEEPGRMQSMGSRRVGHDWATSVSLHFHSLEKDMATHSMFLPGESQGRGSLVGCRLWVPQSRTRLKWLSSIHLEIRFKNLIFWQGGVTLWKMSKWA